MTVNDIPAGLHLCRASGWNQLESDWRVFLNWNPSACRVAERDGTIVGTIAALRYGDCFSWLSMVLVEPSERGAGIGTHLLQEGLDLGSGDEDVGVAHPFRDVPEDRLDVSHGGACFTSRVASVCLAW